MENSTPMTIKEMVEQYDFIMAVLSIPENPVAEKVCKNDYWDYLGIRATRREEERINAEFEEFYADHDAEKAKVRNRRKGDRQHPENKAERKKEKQNRMHRLYGLAYEDTKYGKTVYFWDKKEGQKKFPEYEAEIFRNLKERSAEKSARAEEPAEHIVGWSEIDRMMYNADKVMREIRAEYAEKTYVKNTFDHNFESDSGEICAYPDKYYYAEAEWAYLYYEKYGEQKPDYADMCEMWDRIEHIELVDWLKYA